MNKKIFRAVWLTAVIVLASAVVIIMGSLYWYFSNVQKNQLKIETELAARGAALSGVEYFENIDAESYRITWIAADGTVIYDNEADSSSMENHLEREEVQEALENGYGESTRYSNTLSQRQFYAAVKLDDGSVVRLSSAQSSIGLLLVGFIQPICVVIFIALVLSFVLAFRLSKRIVDPINNINPDEPLEYIGKEEYEEIEPLLRKMRAQQVEIQKTQDTIEKTSLIRQEFTANVSHELKTPLHSISGYAELIENGMAREDDIRPFAGKIRAESARLTNLVEDIIELTKLDSGAKDAKWENSDAYQMAGEVIASLQAAAAEKNISISLQGESAKLEAVPGILHGIIYNLCDNAIKYNRENGTVNVLVDDRDRTVRFTVSDSGIGIPKDQQERIFERFYRVDKSHSREIGGTGLGLSIVKHGLQVLGGTISIESDVEAGTTFVVVLPKCRNRI